ncbi:MAG: endonuclease MutS2 [Oscillospiraceae bacterium]|jgi:DNA mismatch repair protein MutS2|nr:endonuclease MutS2 [Oscillospiraceae bacterium]
MNKHHRTLELHKVLELLAQHTACQEAREFALALEPETNLALAQALLCQTRDAHMLLARFGGPAFGGLTSVNNALRRAQAGSLLTLRELLEVAQVLRVLRGIVTWRDGSAGVESGLDALFGGISPNRFLEDAIGTAILSEDAVADSASPALADIRRKIRQQESNVRSRLEQLCRSTHYSKFLQESLVTSRGGRFVVPVKAEHRSEVPGLVHDASASGATVFVEPMPVVEANNEIKVLQGREREEIERILAALSQLAGSFYEPIAAGYECAVELNLIFAKAQLAYDMHASLPELNNTGETVLIKARHPLINRDTVVPIDVNLGLAFDALVITGPNTGGKTVSLKTLGLLTLMAMCGLMLPVADHSRVAVYSQVLADIGDEQSIEQSLSTFSSHMTNIVSILRSADGHTLALIDELGAGTDPVEGAALATAILEALRAKHAKLAATTHYAEIKACALETAGVENACCEFDVQTLRPTYRLLIGVPGRSNAFAISERLGMPATVVERAKQLVSGESRRFEDVIGQLERRRELAEQTREEAEALRREAREALAKAEQARQESEQKQQKAIEEAKAQGKRIADQVRREANALLGEIERLKKERDSTNDIAELARRARTAMKKGLATVEAAADPLQNAEQEADEAYALPRPLRVGDRVRIVALGAEAEILALPDAKGMVELQAGALRTRSHQDGLRLLGSARTASPNAAVRRRKPKVEEREEPAARMNLASASRLDLRGQTVDECLLELDRFLDGALRNGLQEFTVVHGKGTGALRSAVQQYLKGCAFVKAFRLGAYGEGDHGVTIVELK